MPYILLIDGYNLLGGFGNTDTSKPLSGRGGGRGGRDDVGGDAGAERREALISRLSSYSLRKGHAVTVVFDAWQEPTVTEQREHRTGVQVVFTKRGERADQVIQRMVRNYGRDCAVVSSDLEITQTAKAHGAVVIQSLEFRRRLDRLEDRKIRGRNAGPVSSTRGPAKIEDDEPTRRPDKKGNPRKLPKSVRMRRRRLREF